MPKKLIPLGDDVVIHPIEEPEKIGNLYVPVERQRRTRVHQGIIVAVGPDASGDIDIGDHVLFSGYSGDKVALDESGEFYIMGEEKILAKLENGGVKLLDTETIKRIIRERIGEILAKNGKWVVDGYFQDIQQSLLDRIDTITQAEGFEY